MINVEEQIAEIMRRTKVLERGQIKIGSGTLSAADPNNQTASITLPDGTIILGAAVVGNYIPEVGQDIHYLLNGTQPIAYPPTKPIVSAPPAQVTGVAVTPGLGSLVVRWAALLEADVKWNRGYYQVQVDTVNTFNSGNLKSVDAAGTSCTVTDLTAGTLYYVRVRGVDYVGTVSGSWSATVTGTASLVSEVDVDFAVGAGIESVSALPPIGLPTVANAIRARYDFSNTARITQVAGAVSAYDDLGSNNIDPTQATAGRKPTTGTRNQFGLNVLDFDGVDDGLNSPNFTRAQPVTIFVVAKSDTTSPGANGRQMFGTSTGPTIYIRNVGGVGRWAFYASAEVNSASTIDTNPHVFSAVFNGASSQLWLDGVSEITGNPGAGGWSATPFSIGTDPTYVTNWDGWIGEIIIFDGTMTTLDRQAVEAYLNSKWILGTPTDYPQGSVVFLTTDNKLYRSTGTAWTAAVPAVDITGQITTGQITDSAITTAKINDLAVLSGKLADNAVTQAKIADNQVSNAKIVNDAIDAAKIATGAVGSTELAAGSVIAGKLAAGAVQAGQIAAGAIVAGDIAADTITGAQIAANAISATELAAGSVVAGKIAAGAITTENLTVATIGQSVLLNSGFEELKTADATMAAHWNRYVGSTTTAFVDTAVAGGAQSGQNVMRLIPGAGAHSAVRCDTVPVAPGDLWYIAFYLKSIGTNAGTSPGFYSRIMGGALSSDVTEVVSSMQENFVVPTTWTKYEFQITVPAGYQWMGINLQHFTPNTGSSVLIDSVEMRKVVVSAIIQDGAITTNKIAALQVTAGKIAANTITAAQIAALTITANEIAADAITTNKILAGTILASDISSHTITANEIAASTITSNEIAANTIVAGDIAANTITAGEIAANAVDTSELNANAVTAAKIAALALEVGKYISSTTYVAGSSGWKINADGTAEFGNVVVRGTVAASTIYASTITAGLAANLLPNPGAETNTTGWTATNNTLTRTTTAGQFRSGVGAFQLSSTAAGNMVIETPTGTSGFPVTPGMTYSATAFFKAAASRRVIRIRIRFFNSGGTFTHATTAPDQDATNMWRSIQVSPLALSGDAFCSVELTVESTGAASEVHYIDDISLNTTSSIDGDLYTGFVGSPAVAVYSDNAPKIDLYAGIDGETPGQIYRTVFSQPGSQSVDLTTVTIYGGYPSGGAASFLQLDSSGISSGKNRLTRINTDRLYLNDGGGDLPLHQHSTDNQLMGATLSTTSSTPVEPSTPVRITFNKRYVESYILVTLWGNGLFCNTGLGTTIILYVNADGSNIEIGRSGAPSNGQRVCIFGQRHVLGGAAIGSHTVQWAWLSTTTEWINSDGNSSIGISIKEVSLT